MMMFFFFSSRRRHTRCLSDWSSDVCSSDLTIWGIVPLYSGLLLNEMTSGRASFRTAIQTGFSFLWAGAQWLYPYFRARPAGAPRLELDAMLPINLAVTFLVIGLGAAALVSGIRK